MLQSLLAERFEFTFHRATRERPGYALTELPAPSQDAKGRPMCVDDREPVPSGVARIRSAGLLAELILSIQGGVDRIAPTSVRLHCTYQR